MLCRNLSSKLRKSQKSALWIGCIGNRDGGCDEKYRVAGEISRCSALRVAVCCSELQYDTVIKHCDTLQYTATHCNTLQHTATHCNTLQHTLTASHCHTLRHTATYCDTLQHTATHCNTLQHIATHCNTLQHNTTHNLLHRIRHTSSDCISVTLGDTGRHCNTL